ncbi:MAG TPA: hypothetical protein VLE72_02150 [Candidatus Saccharimonadales bacterium]|nr:hypothetical protein [Candidatus Saccharimonadales bacterium]
MGAEDGPGPEGEEVTSGSPDESKFKAMEEVAKASGPEAEARRREMAEWSNAAGTYAERASQLAENVGQRMVERGESAEQIKKEMGEASGDIAKFGVDFTDDSSKDKNVKPVEGGMKVLDYEKGASTRTPRSPAQVRKPVGSEDEGQVS